MTLAALVLLSLRAEGAPEGAPGGLPAAVAARADVTVTAAARPTAVEVGEPFELELVVVHPVDVAVTGLGEDALELDETWAVLDSSRAAPVSAEDAATGGSTRLVERRTWRVVSLEPGERALPRLGVRLADAELDAEGVLAEGDPVTVSVAGVLAEDEDAPRPLVGFREGFGAPEPRPGGWRLPTALGTAGIALLGGVVVLLARRRRPRERAPARPTPRERLAALVASTEGGASPAELREACFELAALLREATDAWTGAARPGATDDEWLAALERERSASNRVREALAEVLGRCARAKFAGEAPTRWAFQELVARARDLLENHVGEPAPEGRR